MTKTYIKVPIETEGKYCGVGCKGSSGMNCTICPDPTHSLVYFDATGKFLRSKACLDSEIKEDVFTPKIKMFSRQVGKGVYISTLPFINDDYEGAEL